MKKIIVETTCKSMLADLYTPVGIYLRLRDRFRDTILLESTDHHAAENSFSFIGVNAIGGIEIISEDIIEFKFPGHPPEKLPLKEPGAVPDLIWDFMQHFEIKKSDVKEASLAQGLFGYTAYDAVGFFETIHLTKNKAKGNLTIPLMRYRIYQYVIAINHFKDELFLFENTIKDIESELPLVESLIRRKDVPVYPFRISGAERSNLDDEGYRSMVRSGIQSCFRGDVFQLVLSRQFEQSFTGDEFNVYRALRYINPSPYLFYFDYGDYKLMGSSPEAQLLIRNGEALLHPIAGTFRRSGDAEIDKEATERLLKDAKENAEHVMLVDLARNDLSRLCDDVQVVHFKQVQYFSHVIHLVSEVKGKVRKNANSFELIAKTFPAGTLSGAPKFKAMGLIDHLEPTARGFYGGAIGFMGFDGSCNHAIMIRTLMARENTLTYQAGAGIVAASVPENELQEVNNKLGALKKAVILAESL